MELCVVVMLDFCCDVDVGGEWCFRGEGGGLFCGVFGCGNVVLCGDVGGAVLFGTRGVLERTVFFMVFLGEGGAALFFHLSSNSENICCFPLWNGRGLSKKREKFFFGNFGDFGMHNICRERTDFEGVENGC